MVVNIHEAKTNFSRLVDRAANGEEIIIGKAGKPVAKLVPYKEDRRQPRKPGALKGQIWMSQDFDEFDAEIEAMFYADYPNDPLLADKS